MSERENDVRIKFMHASDIHLDTPVIGMTPEKSDERKREIRAAFMRFMDFVRSEEADFVLISGDLFDVEFVTNTTAEIMIREFRNCPTTHFIIAPGRYDPYKGNPLYASGRLPDNCHVFKTQTLDRFDFPEKNVTVYGWGFETPAMTSNPLYDRRVDDISKINIVCGYADLDGALGSQICPISTQDLKNFGADYYALGSRHDKSDFVELDASLYSYPGSLESIGFDEPGIGGINRFVVGYKKGEISIGTKKPAVFGHLEFKTEYIDITGVSQKGEIVNRISKLISDKKYGQDTALRIVITGDIDPRFIIQSHLESDAFGLYFFELIDRTLPIYGTERLARDMSSAGEIYRTLLPMMQSENEEERVIGARAFRIGLAALEGRDADLS